MVSFTGSSVPAGVEPQVIWSLSNQQEAEWNYAQISFSPAYPYLLTFEGIRASNVLGVIGLDDVALFPGACSTKPAKAIVNVADCSFEYGTCAWVPKNPGNSLDLRPQDWKPAGRNQKLDGLRDRTFGLDTGGYVFFDTINIQTKTWLMSPAVPANSALCLQFYFAAAASNSANLQIKRQFGNGTMGDLFWGVKASELEVAEGTAFSAWLPAQLFIPPIPSVSRVVFEGNSADGGFALDDIVVRAASSQASCVTRPAYKKADFNQVNNPFRLVGLEADSETRLQLGNRRQHQLTGSANRLSNLGIYRRGKALETEGENTSTGGGSGGSDGGES